MADQMTPAEMRDRANSLRLAVRPGMYEGQMVNPGVIAFRKNVLAGADALDRLADLILRITEPGRYRVGVYRSVGREK